MGDWLNRGSPDLGAGHTVLGGPYIRRKSLSGSRQQDATIVDNRILLVHIATIKNFAV